MKIYKVTLKRTDKKYENFSFYRTYFHKNLWSILKDANKKCEEKEKKDKNKWIVFDVKKI